MSAKPVTLLQPSLSSQGGASNLEREHVHAVYDRIAPHFSQTRYKPWPVVSAFLSSLPPGWIGLDSGTGNGKYLPLPLPLPHVDADTDSDSSQTQRQRQPGDTWTIGLDRSANLLKFARTAGGKLREVVLGDAMDCCWRRGVFDYAISIATIHHLSVPKRRKAAVQAILRSLSPTHGRALIYVWATQQDGLSKRSIPDAAPAQTDSATSRPDTEPQLTTSGKGTSAGKDVFVPWTLPSGSGASKSTKQTPEGSGENLNPPPHDAVATVSFDRYYHMFDEGELRALVKDAASELGMEERARGASDGLDDADLPTSTSSATTATFLEFVQDGWERSNYYVEIRLWTA